MFHQDETMLSSLTEQASQPPTIELALVAFIKALYENNTEWCARLWPLISNYFATVFTTENVCSREKELCELAALYWTAIDKNQQAIANQLYSLHPLPYLLHHAKIFVNNEPGFQFPMNYGPDFLNQYTAASMQFHQLAKQQLTSDTPAPWAIQYTSLAALPAVASTPSPVFQLNTSASTDINALTAEINNLLLEEDDEIILVTANNETAEPRDISAPVANKSLQFQPPCSQANLTGKMGLHRADVSSPHLPRQSVALADETHMTLHSKRAT